MTENGLEKHHLDTSISIKMMELRVRNQNEGIVRNGLSQIKIGDVILSKRLSFFRQDYIVLKHYEKSSQKMD